MVSPDNWGAVGRVSGSAHSQLLAPLDRGRRERRTRAEGCFGRRAARWSRTRKVGKTAKLRPGLKWGQSGVQEFNWGQAGADQ